MILQLAKRIFFHLTTFHTCYKHIQTMELHVSPQRLGSPIDAHKSTRYPENINEDYRQKSEAIQQLIKGYREMKQEIFTPDQLLQILDMKVLTFLSFSFIRLTSSPFFTQ